MMTKKDQLNLISQAIENLQGIANQLEPEKSNPTVASQYHMTMGQIDAYKACFHLLTGSDMAIRIDIWAREEV